jgi:hypothetical protein
LNRSQAKKASVLREQKKAMRQHDRFGSMIFIFFDAVFEKTIFRIFGVIHISTGYTRARVFYKNLFRTCIKHLVCNLV